MWGPGFNVRPGGTAHNVETKQKPLTFNKYLCTQCYIHVLYSSTREWVWWLEVISFAENMKLCLCYCSQMHGGCGEDILRNTHQLPLLQSSKAIKGTHTVIGHVQVSPPQQTHLQRFCRSWILISTKQKCHTGNWSRWKWTAKCRLCVTAQRRLVAPVNSGWNQKPSASKQAADSRGWRADSIKY